MIPAIIGGIISLGGEWFKNKREVTKAKHESTIRRIDADSDWELEQVKGSQQSWKDEFWTVVLAVPLFLVFFPQSRPWVKDGFDALNSSVPEWYLMALGAAIGAAFGVKPLVTAITKKVKK